MKINDAIFGVVLLVLGIVILTHVQGFPTIPGQKVGPALFPGVVAAGLVICGILLIASGIGRRSTEPWFQMADWVRSGQHITAFAAIIAGVIAYIAWVDDLGFLLLAPILLFVWFIVFKVRLLPAAVTSLVVAVVIWYAFYKLLRVPLPWGLLKAYAF
jgi:putative tricarboxylic transport membrane protein